MRTGILLFVLALSCTPKPPTPENPGSPRPAIVKCGVDAVTKAAPKALPLVNECLAAISGDVTSCLLGLIKPAIDITYEVIVCLTRNEGAAANAAAQANPENTVDARRAARAREFLAGQGVQFAD